MPCGLRRVPAAMLKDFNRVLGIFEGLVAHSGVLFLRKSLFLFNIQYKITKNRKYTESRLLLAYPSEVN